MIISNLKTHQDAYAKIYEELCKCKSYYEKFIEAGNEFKENEEPEKFALLTLNNDFLKIYRKHEIWIHVSTRENFQPFFDMISILNNIALYNALHLIKVEKGE